MKSGTLATVFVCAALAIPALGLETPALETPALPIVDAYPHSVVFASSPAEELEYSLGLGALQKIGGRWRHKHMERITGELSRTTWEIDPGYTAEEALEWSLQRLPGGSELIYSCDGRSCGSSAQWASRVFGQRVLYGHDERQRYRVFRLAQAGAEFRLIFYAVDRANRRHYLHMDVLRLVERADD